MKTIVFTENTERELSQAAEIIRSGGLLGIPTETVYGLGADGLNEDAVRRIFEAKGRPQDNPLILHIADASWLTRYCEAVPEAAYRLARAFWPGPLTMILPKKPVVPLRTTGGLPTVGMRCPNHPITLKIIEKAGVPIAAPSGNRSGRPSPTTAAAMLEDMDGRINAIFDGGACAVGVESSIIDLTCTPPRLLRAGGLPLEQLRQLLGEVEIDECITKPVSPDQRPKAPGMKYRHYAPKAPVRVICGSGERSAEYILQNAPKGAGVVCFSEYAPRFSDFTVHTLGSQNDKLSQAQHVFAALRRFDETDVPCIFAQCPDEGGLGLAVANRLKKAAGFDVVEV